MPAAIQPFLFFIKLPDLGKLITVYVNINSAFEPSQKSLFHLQVLKCRQLIFMQPICLASPMKFSTSHIRIIVPIPTFKSVEFKECIRKLDLEITEIKETTPTALQECLQYTCTAKLSPDWNILGDSLIEGQRFLTDNGPLNSVKMEIFVSNKEISLCLLPSCIKFPPLRMEYYATDEQLTNSLMIPVEEKCIVFPSLKTAILLSISRSPMPFGQFTTYAEFQEHWKNMYGYILPPIPEQKNIWYFNVTFRVPNATSFTYPQFCVRSHGPTVIPRVDPRPILAAFIKNFCKKVTNICGEKCRIIEGKASFPELGLFLAENISEDMKPRPGTTYAMKPNVPYRKDLSNVNSACNKNVQTNNANKICDNKSNSVLNTALDSQSKNILSGQMKRNTTNTNVSVPKHEKDSSEDIQNQGNSIGAPITQPSAITNLSTPILQVSTSNSIETPPVKYAPCFYPKKPKTIQKTLESAKKNVYAPQFLPTKRPVMKQDSKVPMVNAKLKNGAPAMKEPAQVNTILNCFNIKKKIPDTMKSAQPVKRASTGNKPTTGNAKVSKKLKKV